MAGWDLGGLEFGLELGLLISNILTYVRHINTASHHWNGNRTTQKRQIAEKQVDGTVESVTRNMSSILYINMYFNIYFG